MFRTIGVAAAVAASLGLAVPAQAQWHGYRPYRGHHDRIDGGDVLLGALIAGGVIAVASAAANADRARRAAPAAEPLPAEWADPDGPDGGFEPDQRGEPPVAPDAGDDGDDDSASAADADQDAAADACAAAAEAEGQRLARHATVSAVTDVDRAGDGWFVAGTIELADGDREVGTERHFRCNVADGQAPDVRIDGGVLARR